MRITINTFNLGACIIVTLYTGCAAPQATIKKQEAQVSAPHASGLDAEAKERLARVFDEGIKRLGNDPKEALKLFDEVLLSFPERWEVHYNAGLACSRLTETARAEDEFAKALKYNAPQADVFNALGTTYMAAGNMAKAVETLKKALEIKESAATMINIASAYQALRQNDKAISYFRKAAAEDPSNTILHQNMGILLYNMGNYKGAIDEFNKALEKNGGDAGLLASSAQSVMKTGDFEGAAKLFQKMLVLNPDDPAPYLNIGIIYEIYIGDREKAVENFSSYIKMKGPRVKEVEGWIEVARNKAKPKEGG